VLDLLTDTVDDVATITLVGDVDLATGPRLAEELDRALAGGASRVVLDCRGLGYLDSTGLRVLAEAPADLELSLTNVPPGVRKIFRIVDMTSYLAD
jgi:anti-anti-sigma factor